MSIIRELQDVTTNGIHVVTTNDDECSENVKTETNALECDADDCIDDHLPAASIGSTTMRQPSGNESDVLDEKIIEKKKRSKENVKPVVLATPFAIQQTPLGNSLDIFFRAMCATVKTFPSPDIAEIKLKISQIVGTKEIEIINRNRK